VAVVSYGADASGAVEVCASLAGSPEGRDVIRDTELSAAAVRVEQVTEQVSNGIGGLVEVTRKRPVFVDLEPAAAASPVAAFEAVRDLSERWRESCPEGSPAPVVLHLSRGRFDSEQIDEAVGVFEGMAAAPLLHHLIVTESPHPSLAYPADAEGIEDAALRRLWDASGPLVAREALAGRKPAVSERSRGFVVNGRFDLLVEGLGLALAGSQPGADA
jgi:hypothetical protein